MVSGINQNMAAVLQSSRTGALLGNLVRKVFSSQRTFDFLYESTHSRRRNTHRECFKFLPSFKTGPSTFTVFNTMRTLHKSAFSRVLSKAHDYQRKLCGWGGSKGGDLRGRPCLRHKNVKSYTSLFRIEKPENDTLLAERPHIGNIWEYLYCA